MIFANAKTENTRWNNNVLLKPIFNFTTIIWLTSFSMDLFFGQAFCCQVEISFPYQWKCPTIVLEPAVLLSSFNDQPKWHTRWINPVAEIDFFMSPFPLHFLLSFLFEQCSAFCATLYGCPIIKFTWFSRSEC